MWIGCKHLNLQARIRGMRGAISPGMRRVPHTPGFLLAALFLALPLFGATAPQTVDVTSQFFGAELRVNNLRATEIGGIVLLRGDTDDPAQAAAASSYAQSLGFARVANLIRVVDHPNDDQIERVAERKLATRTLDGCSFHIESIRGIVTLAGKVRHELQKDLALALVRNIDGVREVRSSLQK